MTRKHYLRTQTWYVQSLSSGWQYVLRLVFQVRVYKAQPSSLFFSFVNPTSRTMSSSPCVQIPSSVTSSLCSINPKAWIISFGKVIFFLLVHSRLTMSLQPDLRYYLSLETQSPLAISQSQTQMEHTTMEDTKKTAMTSNSESSMITSGLVFYCESYPPYRTLHFKFSYPVNSSGDLGCNYPLVG